MSRDPTEHTISLDLIGHTMTLRWPADWGPAPLRLTRIEVTRSGWSGSGPTSGGGEATWEFSGDQGWQEGWDRLQQPKGWTLGGSLGLQALLLISLYRRQKDADAWLESLVAERESWASLERLRPDLCSDPVLQAWKQSVESQRTASGKRRKAGKVGAPRGSRESLRNVLLAMAIGELETAKKYGRKLTQVEAVRRVVKRFPALAPDDGDASDLLFGESLKKEIKTFRQRFQQIGKPR